MRLEIGVRVMKNQRNRSVTPRLLLSVTFALLSFVFLLSSAGCNSSLNASPSEVTSDTSNIRATSNELEVDFLDVGQGDAALITLGEHAMLIDGGEKAYSPLIMDVLKERGITKLDYVINSNPHDDYVGGLSGAFQAASVGAVFSSVDDYDTQGFKTFIAAAEEQGLTITVPQNGDELDFAGASLTFYMTTDPSDSTGGNCLVIQLEYGSYSVLFTGDMTSDEEQELLDANVMLNSTVLMVSQHGSDNSTSDAFLKAVNPSTAVISVGEDNIYGLPSEKTLAKIHERGIDLFRTDL